MASYCIRFSSILQELRPICKTRNQFSTKQKTKPIGLGLPTISSNTIDAIHHVYAGKRWGKHLTEYRDQLIHENPHLVKFIESQISKYPRRIHTAMFEVVIGTLTVLDHQALVDAKH